MHQLNLKPQAREKEKGESLYAPPKSLTQREREREERWEEEMQEIAEGVGNGGK